MIYEILIGIVLYAVLFVVTVQNSRRKVMVLQERLDKIRMMQAQQEAQSQQSIAQNEEKIRELETLLRKLGDENSLLRLELEEKKATLYYNNKVAMLENEKRQQAETVIFSSDIYHRIQECLNGGRSLSHHDWTALAEMVNSIYTGFTEKLYSLYRMSEQDYHVSLLIKVRVQPKDIALLTGKQHLYRLHGEIIQSLPHVGTGLSRQSAHQGESPTEGYCPADGPFEGECGVNPQPTVSEGLRTKGIIEGLGRFHPLTINRKMNQMNK